MQPRHWQRDGHPEVRDSAEAAAGGGQEPAGGEVLWLWRLGLEACVAVRGRVSGERNDTERTWGGRGVHRSATLSWGKFASP